MAGGAALITGASSGIGLELARLCAKDGYSLFLVARREAELREIAGQLSRDHRVEAFVIPADLSDPAAPESVLDGLRGTVPEMLINNAGFGLRGPFVETDWDTEARMIQVNIASLARLTKLVLPGMMARGSGRVLNVASTAAFVPGPFMAVYYASKAFVLSFSHAIASETEGTGVTVTVLCPGPTRTGFTESAGMEASNLFRGPTMNAAEVAGEGYRAMLAGKAEIIAGSRNRRLIFSTRFAPRTLLARMTRRLNSIAT
jgi:short-subunit dehydrogenase